MIAPARVASELAHAVGQITGSDIAGSRATSWRHGEAILPIFVDCGALVCFQEKPEVLPFDLLFADVPIVHLGSQTRGLRSVQLENGSSSWTTTSVGLPRIERGLTLSSRMLASFRRNRQEWPILQEIASNGWRFGRQWPKASPTHSHPPSARTCI